MHQTTITYGDQRKSQFIVIYTPHVERDDNTLVVLIHGGFYKSIHGLEHMKPLALDLARDGYTVANIEYVRVGEGMNCNQMIRNVFKSYDHLVHFYPHKTNTVVVGHSAGGHLALMLAIRDQLVGTALEVNQSLVPRKVLAQAPLTNLLRAQNERLSDDGDAIQKFIGYGSDETKRRLKCLRLSPSSYNAPQKCDVRIFHGDKDKDVPLAHSISYYQNLGGPQSAKVSFFPLSEVDHYELITPEHPSWKFQKSFIC